MEQGYILSAKAARQDRHAGAAAINYWRNLACSSGGRGPSPPNITTPGTRPPRPSEATASPTRGQADARQRACGSRAERRRPGDEGRSIKNCSVRSSRRGHRRLPSAITLMVRDRPPYEDPRRARTPCSRRIALRDRRPRPCLGGQGRPDHIDPRRDRQESPAARPRDGLAESPTEVTVKARRRTRRSRSNQIASIRYDGQPAASTSPRPRVGRQPGRGGRPIQEGGGRIAGQAVHRRRRAQFQPGPRRWPTRPDRPRPSARRGRSLCSTASSSPPQQPPRRPRPGGAGQAPGAEGGLRRGRGRPSPDRQAAPGADRAAVLRARVARQEGRPRPAIAELDQMIPSAPEGSRKSARRPARQGREPGRPEEIRRGRGRRPRA